MRQHQGFAAALLASALLLPWPAATRADAPERDADLAEQARTVLRRHCLRCHGDKPRGGVRLLGQPLHGSARNLVVPGAPDRSLLLDLVEGGSMPPGELPKVPVKDRAVLRDWVRAGAAPFPSETGRDFLLRQLADDFRKLPEPDKAHVRYLSLDHLGPDKAKRLAVAAVLRAVLRHLSVPGKPPVEPVAVEPSGRLLRIDLRRGGWDRKPFKNETLNLFDMVLLEYPYGMLPDGKLPADLTAFLRQTRQVRPIPYVRGDWLAREAVREPLHSDLLEALGKPEGAQPPGEAMEPLPNETIGFDEAVRELETSPDPRLLQGVLRAVKALIPLGRKGTVKRAVWERHYLEVVRLMGGSLPILPLDGLTWPNHNPDPELKVRFRLIVPGSGPQDDPPAKSRFIAGKDRYSLWIHSNKDVTLEMVYTDARSNSVQVGKKTYLVLAGQPLIFSGKDGKGMRVPATFDGKQIQESFTLYAIPTEALVGGVYPAGKVIQGENIADRFLHPLYELSEKGEVGKSSDAGKMVKITLPVTFVKP